MKGRAIYAMSDGEKTYSERFLGAVIVSPKATDSKLMTALKIA
jgi:hypothetical protein